MCKKLGQIDLTFLLFLGEKDMKSKLFLIAFVILSFALTVSAQKQEDIEFRQEFEKFESSILADNPNSDENFFLLAKVSKDNSETARIKLAFKGLDKSYKITVTPLKYEKDASGKFTRQEFTEDIATASFKGIMKLEDFHSPTIITPVNVEANAIEILFETADGRNPKITLKLDDKIPNVGTLNSVK